MGQVWVVTTMGTAGGRGAIGLDVCADASCLDGNVDHPFASWVFYPAPYAGGVTLLGHPQPDVLLVSNGGHEIEFDLKSRSWTLGN